MGFADTLDDDDYGLIIDKNGNIKGIWVPQHLEEEAEIPASIANLCETNFGVDPNDESCYHTIH